MKGSNVKKPTRLHRKGEPIFAQDGLWRLLAVVMLSAFAYYMYGAIFSVVSPAVRSAAKVMGIEAQSVDRRSPQLYRQAPGGD